MTVGHIVFGTAFAAGSVWLIYQTTEKERAALAAVLAAASIAVFMGFV